QCASVYRRNGQWLMAPISHRPWRSSVSTGFRGPDRALILLGHRAETFVDKLLQPLTAIRLGRVDVALRVGRDAVHGVELPRLTAAVAEAGELGQRLAIEDVNFLVGAVGEIQILLLRIARERDVPRRAVAERVLEDLRLFHELAVLLEHLDP